MFCEHQVHSRYFPGGEAKFEELLRQLETAEEYIFVEYFIIDEGLMWGKILEAVSYTHLEEVMPDKNAQWLIYCRTGRRSADAAQKLEAVSYTHLDVYKRQSSTRT